MDDIFKLPEDEFDRFIDTCMDIANRGAKLLYRIKNIDVRNNYNLGEKRKYLLIGPSGAGMSTVTNMLVKNAVSDEIYDGPAKTGNNANAVTTEYAEYDLDEENVIVDSIGLTSNVEHQPEAFYKLGKYILENPNLCGIIFLHPKERIVGENRKMFEALVELLDDPYFFGKIMFGVTDVQSKRDGIKWVKSFGRSDRNDLVRTLELCGKNISCGNIKNYASYSSDDDDDKNIQALRYELLNGMNIYIQNHTRPLNYDRSKMLKRLDSTVMNLLKKEQTILTQFEAISRSFRADNTI